MTFNTSIEVSLKLQEMGICIKSQDMHVKYKDTYIIWDYCTGELSNPPAYRNGIHAYRLDELPEVLKEVGKIKKWVDKEYTQECGKISISRPVAKIHRQDWLNRYLKVCHIYAIDGNLVANEYLLSIL